MGRVFYLTFFLLIMSGWSAQANVCITDIYQGASFTEAAYDYEISYVDYEVHKASLTCQELDNINNGLQVVGIGLAAGGLYAACTGVGLPATIALEGGAIAVTAIGLLVSNLDCEDVETDAKIKSKVDEAVCTALRAQGISCQTPIKEKNNQSIEI